MRNKKLVYLFAFVFSILFSFVYFFIFYSYLPIKNNEAITLYMNQIGLYKEEENANKVKVSLETKDVKTYIYRNENLYVVVCGVGDKEYVQTIGDTLKELNYSYVLKKVEITDEEICNYVKEENYEEALELIGNQSQGNAD